MATKKASKNAGKKKKPSKKANASSPASFAKDLEKLMKKHAIEAKVMLSAEPGLDCPEGFHVEMVTIQEPNGDTTLKPICVKDD